MDYIEFDANVGEEGIISVPGELRRKVAQHQRVHVILTEPRVPRRPDEEVLGYYMRHPFIIPGFKMPTRDEMHDREYDDGLEQMLRYPLG
ncbi:MAG TPA: hypothetical protein VFX22_06580, partial [Candidatus Kapabacteria bacterium]|nr:hypothetical protein [Candidatus Kapabacteria bacterium]